MHHTISVLHECTSKIISPVLKLRGMAVGKPSEVMMTMTTSTAPPTPPEHPPQATHNLKPPSTWAASMVSNSNVWSECNNNYDSSNILCGNPTKISPPPSNATVNDIRVDDDTRPLQPNNTTSNLARLQEWSDFQAGFDEFLLGFAKFHKERGLPDTRPPPRTCSNDDDDTEITCGTAEFRQVIGKLKQVNRECNQLLDQLEQQAPRSETINAITSTPQQQVHIAQLPCVDEHAPPALLSNAPFSTPALQMILLGPSPWAQQPQPTTRNVTTMVASDRTFEKLPPPAPDPVDMESTDWPQPRPARKTIPFKKKTKAKHTFI